MALWKQMLFCLIKQAGPRQKKSKYIKSLKQLIHVANLRQESANRIHVDDLGGSFSRVSQTFLCASIPDYKWKIATSVLTRSVKYT